MHEALGRAAVAVAVICALATAGCGDEEGTSGGSGGGKSERLEIAFLPGVVANPYFKAEIEAMKEVSKAENVNLTVIDSGLDANKQAQQLQDLASAGKHDGILIVPLSGAALVPAAKQALDSDISVGAVDVPLGPDSTSTEAQVPGQAVFSGRPFSKQGENLGMLTVEACAGAGPCRVAFMYGVKASVYDQVLYDGFKRGISSAPNVEVVAEAEGGYTREGGLKATQNLIQANKDLDVIVTVDQSGLGAESALKAAELEDEVKIIGFGGARQAIDAVKAGRWFGDSVQVPRTEARLAIEGVIAAIRENRVTGYVDPVKEAGAPDDGRVTRENAARFRPEYDG